jgi:hypothetical protein
LAASLFEAAVEWQLLALFGLGSLSDLSPLCAQKRKIERHHNMDRAGNLVPCIDRRSGDLELMIESDSNQEFAPMSKPTTTNENEKPSHPSVPSTPPNWGALPDNCVIVERTGEKFALVGPPMRRIEPKD